MGYLLFHKTLRWWQRLCTHLVRRAAYGRVSADAPACASQPRARRAIALLPP
ncbi:hypothetical protein BVG79_00064 [Ketogulonicigenium robustum]|uniref:Uncharacterized protein n=1 Tax=Ketogulonicigenium robustum TaxID=92947 RepID=A0A1W6NW32_9RHOB|nr:hypothetical protein BVG79_00064 [Ketogulonicigenium robustum]